MWKCMSYSYREGGIEFDPIPRGFKSQKMYKYSLHVARTNVNLLIITANENAFTEKSQILHQVNKKHFNTQMWT